MKKNIQPEFSFPVDIARVGSTYKLAPDAAQRDAIAKRLKIESVDAFEATLTLKAGRGDHIIVNGKIVADVVQSCVVSLEPVPAHIEETFEVIFSETASALEEFNPHDDSEAPEPIENGKIDLGELAVQYLSLSLEPFPRKEGAVFAGYDDETR